MIRYIFAQPLIGGMGIGFEKAFGVPPIAIITAGFDNDKHYIKYMNETRDLNIPIINMESDYETFKSKDDEILYNKVVKNIDVLAHVAICSGLSQMNSSNSGSKARGDANNDQNQNMYNLTKLGMRMKAKVVAFENAPQAYTSSGEGTIEKLKEIAESYNYSTHLFKTDTLLHGIPQSRKRTFIMFYSDKNPGLFNYDHTDYTNLKNYLKEVPKDALYSSDFIEEPSVILGGLYKFVLDKTNSKTLLEAIEKLDKKDKETWTVAQLTELIGFDEAIAYFEEKILKEDDEEKNKLQKILQNVKHYKNKKEQGKSFWDNTTILANRGKFTNAIVGKSLTSMINPNEERPYTIRELLHLMGHPHDFEMINPNKNWNHICQNVPVKTATFIGSQIKEYLDGNLPISSTSFVKQDNIKQRLDTASQQVHENW